MEEDGPEEEKVPVYLRQLEQILLRGRADETDDALAEAAVDVAEAAVDAVEPVVDVAAAPPRSHLFESAQKRSLLALPALEALTMTVRSRRTVKIF